MTDLYTAATAWAAAGCSVVPVNTDGSKRPVGQWKQYQTTPAGPDDIGDWWGNPHGDHQPPEYGIGIVCGAVSGHLEMLEFEGRAVDEGMPEKYREALDDHGQTDLWNTISTGYMEQTPSGGLHFLYRVGDGEARGNTKLARRPGPQPGTVDVLIETRGTGGFVVVAPSAGTVHPTGKPWTTLLGSPATIPTITVEQRDTLYAIASLLDQMPAHEPENIPAPIPDLPGSTPGTRPGDDYNQRATWDEILGGRGWDRMWRLGTGYGWRRPGKEDRSISATTGTSTDGADRLYVFSSSTDFDTERPYSKFAAYAHLEHNGDYAAAAKQLAADGYGKAPTIDAPPVIVGDIRPARRLQSVPPPVDGTAALQPTPAPTGSPRHTENGNALALIGRHGQQVRYVVDRGRWLHWEGSRWSEQPSGGGIVRELHKDTAHAMPEDQGSTTWRAKSLSAVGTSNTLLQASTDPRITVTMDDLDADPWALATPDGIVDLRTGNITPSDSSHLITRNTACTPDPDADTTRWLDFLNITFGGDTELIAYLQRLIGYSATGHIGPHVLPFAHGSGGNGKGVFLEAIAKVLGDYASTAPNAFLMARNYSQHETEIARLSGARMVLCSEVNEDDKFDEAKVKQLTGGDTLTARFMRQDHFTFTPTHHLWLMGNYRPSVTSGGRAFWRRCRLIPFLHEVPEHQRVDDLQGILARDHGPAILQWIITGAAAYHRDGLQEPASVTQATEEYARDQDTVARFVDEMCHVAASPDVKIETRELQATYNRWCEDVGEAPVTAKRFGVDLRNRFEVRVSRSNGKRFYCGITALERDSSDEQSVTDGPDEWWKR